MVFIARLIVVFQFYFCLSVRFDGKPKDVKEIKGQIATLKCFLGDFNKTINVVSWWKGQEQLSLKEETITEDGRMSVKLDELPPFTGNAYSYSLLVVDIVLADQGEYHCEIYNTPIIKSGTADLTVMQVPSPEYPQCTRSANRYIVDSQVTLTCISELLSPPVELKWSRGSNLISPDLQSSKRHESLVYKHYTFVAKKNDNDAVFVCEQTNQVNNDVNNCTIQNVNIQYRPELKIQHTDVFFSGSDAILFCQSFANPPVTHFAWKFTPVLNANEYITDGQLLTLIKPSTVRNGTLVTCSGENNVGESSDTTTIYILKERIHEDEYINKNNPVWLQESEQNHIDGEVDNEEVSLYVVIIIIVLIIIIVVVVVIIPVYYQCFCKTRTTTDLSGREIYQPTVYYDTRDGVSNSGLYDRSLPRLPSSVHYGHWRHSSASQVPEDFDQRGYTYIEGRNAQNMS